MAAFRTDRNDRSSVDRRVRGDDSAGRDGESGTIPSVARVCSHELHDELCAAGVLLVRESRQTPGHQLNYRDRIRGATGIVLPNGSIIFDARRNRAVPLVDQERYLTILRSASTIGS
jgi:hypothetical protein